MFRIIFIAVALVFAAPAIPASANDGGALNLKAASFSEQRASIDADFADGETYAEIGRQQRAEVSAALDRIDSHLGRAESVDALDETTRAKVFNDQELVNTLLTQARSDSRLICNREKKVGTNRPTTVCLTVAQRRGALENTQDALRDGQRTRFIKSD